MWGERRAAAVMDGLHVRSNSLQARGGPWKTRRKGKDKHRCNGSDSPALRPPLTHFLPLIRCVSEGRWWIVFNLDYALWVCFCQKKKKGYSLCTAVLQKHSSSPQTAGTFLCAAGHSKDGKHRFSGRFVFPFALMNACPVQPAVSSAGLLENLSSCGFVSVSFWTQSTTAATAAPSTGAKV